MWITWEYLHDGGQSAQEFVDWVVSLDDPGHVTHLPRVTSNDIIRRAKRVRRA